MCLFIQLQSVKPGREGKQQYISLGVYKLNISVRFRNNFPGKRTIASPIRDASCNLGNSLLGGKVFFDSFLIIKFIFNNKGLLNTPKPYMPKYVNRNQSNHAEIWCCFENSVLILKDKNSARALIVIQK